MNSYIYFIIPQKLLYTIFPLLSLPLFPFSTVISVWRIFTAFHIRSLLNPGQADIRNPLRLKSAKTKDKVRTMFRCSDLAFSVKYLIFFFQRRFGNYLTIPTIPPTPKSLPVQEQWLYVYFKHIWKILQAVTDFVQNMACFLSQFKAISCRYIVWVIPMFLPLSKP